MLNEECGRLKAVVLAAGKGTRLQTESSDIPKVMRQASGRPLLGYVLEALSFINKKDIIIVAGYKKDEIINRFSGYSYAVQAEQLGTGHAVMAARGELKDFQGDVLICYGDMPAVRRETYEALVNAHFEQENDCTILTGDYQTTPAHSTRQGNSPTPPHSLLQQGNSPRQRQMPAEEMRIPLPYGRIIRDLNGSFVHVVEDRDCTPEQLKITELNSGVYVFKTKPLLEALKGLNNDNAQGEYYLTDAPAIIRAGGGRVGILKRDLGDEIIGVNTLAQLAQVEEILSSRQSGACAP